MFVGSMSVVHGLPEVGARDCGAGASGEKTHSECEFSNSLRGPETKWLLLGGSELLISRSIQAEAISPLGPSLQLHSCVGWAQV